MSTRSRLVALGALLTASGLAAACGSPTPPPNLLPAKPPSASPSPAPSVTAAPTSAPVSGDAALAAGKTFASTFFTTDYRKIDAYLGTVEMLSTGAFQSDLEAKQDQLRSLTGSAQSIATGRVLAAGVRDVTPTTATVLVAANQDVRNKRTAGKPTTQRYRIVERMRLVDGQWLLEDLEPVSDAVEGGCTDATASADAQALLQESCRAFEQLYSYDYSDLDGALRRQEAITTGSLRRQVESIAPQLRARIGSAKGRVVAQACLAAVEDADGDSATILVFFNETVTSTQYAQPRLDRNRVEATMQRVDGRWLVSGIKAL